MNQTQSILLSILFTTIFVGSASYYFFYEDCQVDLVDFKPATLWDDRPSNEVAIPVDNVPAQPLATGTLSYYIPEMGIHFEYPAYATVTVKMLNGTTGNLLSGTIYLSHNTDAPYDAETISFSGITSDYLNPKPMTRDITDTVGYLTDGNGVFYSSVSNKENSLPLPVAYTLPLSSGDGIAVMVTDMEYAGPSSIVAIINTKNNRFPGIAFSGFAKNSEARTRFESIIRSIEVE